MKNPSAFLTAALVTWSLSAAGDQTPTPIRSILEKHDQSGLPGKEIVLGTASLPSGSVIGFHTHPGDEDGYVLKGRLILRVKGQPDRVLHPGDHFFNPRVLVHSVAAADAEGGVALSTWIVDKDKPLATPVSQ
jgi:quercetin dioxygenase-like cupin family protein